MFVNPFGGIDVFAAIFRSYVSLTRRFRHLQLRSFAVRLVTCLNQARLDDHLS